MRPGTIVPDDLAARLRGHVEMLASTIGERNVFLPERLAAARDYIETTWRAQGYEVSAQEYQTHGVTCANLEVSRTGTASPVRSCCSARTTTRSGTALAPTTMAAASRRSSSSRVTSRR